MSVLSIIVTEVTVDWTIMDQIAVAALEIGKDDLAEVLFRGGCLTKGLYKPAICSVSDVTANTRRRGNAT